MSLSQQITTFIAANWVSFAKKEDTLLAQTCTASSKLKCYGSLAQCWKIFKESWTALSKQELANKACRKGQNVDIIVVRTLQERVRCDLRLVGGDDADELIWAGLMLWRMLQRTFGANFMGQNVMASDLPYFEICALF